MWETEYTDEFEAWWEDLTADQQESIAAAVGVLEDFGPTLGRPLVDRISTSRHQHMKELRVSQDGALRVLFAYDPRQMAILLLGGNKSGRWNAWYRTAIPAADRLYDEHLRDLKREGAI